jgi:hypothetical protein
MRWLCVLFLVACHIPQKPQHTQVDQLGAAETAMWFTRAAMAGDEATAMSLSFSLMWATSVTKKSHNDEKWDDSIKEVITKLASEGDDTGVEVVSAQVIDWKLLKQSDNEKLMRDVEVATVKIKLREADGKEHAAMPLIFIKTEGGWKFSPHG